MPPSVPARPSADALRDLAEKYRQLASMRRARARGEPVPVRAVFRRLAQSYPGALRELDTLPLEVLDARADALDAAASGRADAFAPWMSWLADYHAWMRAALAIKRHTIRDRTPDALRAAEIARDVGAVCDLALDPPFVAACAMPPGGRLRPVVLERLAALHSVAPSELRATLFPRLG